MLIAVIRAHAREREREREEGRGGSRALRGRDIRAVFRRFATCIYMYLRSRSLNFSFSRPANRAIALAFFMRRGWFLDPH